MKRLSRVLQLQMPRAFLGLLIWAVLAILPALSQTALATQKQADKDLDQAVSQTAFIYQGQLKEDGAPAIGPHDFQFTLYPTLTGGNQLDSIVYENIDLVNGLFNVELDFGVAPLQSSESWLEVAVRPSGDTEPYIALSPRQRLTTTPYAIFAQHEEWSLIGVPVGFTGGVDKDEGALVKEADVMKDESGEPATAKQANLWSANGPHIYNTNTGNVGIGTSNPQERLDVDGYVRLGGGANIHRWTLGTGGDSFAGQGFFFIKDVDANSIKLTIDQNTDNVSMRTLTLGNNANNVLHLVGTGSQFGEFAKLNFGDGNNVLLQEDADDKLTIHARLRTAIMGGNVGIGTVNPGTRLHVVGNRIRLENGGKILDLRADGAALDIQSTTNSLFLRTSGPDNHVVINPFGGDGNVGIGTGSPQAKLDVNGTARTRVLQITGGSDLAEPFEISGVEATSPGMVVAIDPARPGQLRIADKAYDRTVAGIVSGANGINPGLTMKQVGTLAEGSLPVSLSGRVYCWADASSGPINPGDLLTTSDTPGHAMKVTNYTRAQGAIIGKAMTELKQGKGLILVLVTLQ